MAIGENDERARNLIDAWKDQRAAAALEKYWTEKASANSEFTQADAVEQILYNLERYESALGRIAAQSGAGAQIARETLAYRRPDWR
jgi:hypothetical protein